METLKEEIEQGVCGDKMKVKIDKEKVERYFILRDSNGREVSRVSIVNLKIYNQLRK